MNFIDTNYFIRFFIKDNIDQYKQVEDLLKKGAARKIALFTSTVVIFEVYWVLARFYKKNKFESIEILVEILKWKFIEVYERKILLKAIGIFAQTNLDLEDCYHIAFAGYNKAGDLLTFDRKLKKEFLKRL